MSKLFLLIFLGLVFFIGGQWLGLTFRPTASEVSNALSNTPKLTEPEAGLVESSLNPFTDPAPLKKDYRR